MGKTYRRSGDDDGRRMKLRNHRQPDPKRSGKNRVMNDFVEDDIFDDDVNITDSIVINKTRDEQS